MKNAAKEIEFIISQINNSWLNKETKNLAEFFHESMIIADSNMKRLANNRDECIASYESFIKQAKILNYSEYDMNVKVFGNTAIANYTFDISWEVNNKASSDKGRDVFVFENTNGKWLAVWRTLLPLF